MADNDKILDRVRKLLAMAEGAQTPEEADAFNARAEDMLQKYGIDRAMAEAKAEVRTKPITRKFTLDGDYGPDQAKLWHVITKYNRCKSIRVTTKSPSYDEVGNYTKPKRGYYVKVTGYSQDVEICELLFTSLHLQIASRLRQVKGTFDMNARTTRCSYFSGFNEAVGTRLRNEQTAAEEEAEETTAGTALVLRNRNIEVEQAYETENPDAHTLYNRRQLSMSHYQAGHKHGMNANLHNRAEAPAPSRREIS